ncbi:MAG TPA: M28 family peptidase, partial [Geminicoccaceae bacterium]|nr:M28 family peptidase [Geminicoccaceae bacterium]
MPTINGERLLADLRRLADFGRYRTGVHRPTYSPQDVESRHWLAERMRDAGLDPVIDGIGNVVGRGPGAGPRLLLGSHSESQPHAGWLDGALGVVYGLEVARSFREDPASADLGIDVVAFADEEGHYGSFIGSRSFCDELAEEEIDRLANRYDGTPLREALDRAGLAGRPRERIEPGRYVGFLETHIEQGDYLESAGLRIGIVTSIVGIWQYRV